MLTFPNRGMIWQTTQVGFARVRRPFPFPLGDREGASDGRDPNDGENVNERPWFPSTVER
jgi:hypothetical protein